MKTISPQNSLRLRRTTGWLALAGCLLASHAAQAHVTYSGRNFGNFSGLTNASASITNQTVTGNYGWADAADGVLGDSHRGRAFRFHLDHTALVTLTVAPNSLATTNNPLGDLTPAFSIYSGLAGIAPYAVGWTNYPVSADHDGTAASLVWRAWWEQQNLGGDGTTNVFATDGSWNALGDWKIGGDGDLPGDFAQLSSFIYKGSATSTISSGPVAGTFALSAGDYTIFIGGNDPGNKTAGSAGQARGISATLTVTPAPALSIGEKVFISWPAGTGTNWVLQSAPFVNTNAWTTVTNAPIIVDGAPGVLLDQAGAQQFFRFHYVP
jgi:hypothetical protein